jgi:hypothetical protein
MAAGSWGVSFDLSCSLNKCKKLNHMLVGGFMACFFVQYYQLLRKTAGSLGGII